MKSVLQLENTNALDFKNEIILGVINALKGFTTNSENEQLLTRNETAKMLSISLVTLWNWTRKNLIPAYRIGNKVRYKKGEIMQALNKKNKFD